MGRLACSSNSELECRAEDVEMETNKLKEARVKNKARFDQIKRVRPRKIQEGDEILLQYILASTTSTLLIESLQKGGFGLIK